MKRVAHSALVNAYQRIFDVSVLISLSALISVSRLAGTALPARAWQSCADC
jgi:hypothetical protein